eukprot:gene18951-6304_t
MEKSSQENSGKRSNQEEEKRNTPVHTALDANFISIVGKRYHANTNIKEIPDTTGVPQYTPHTKCPLIISPSQERVENSSSPTNKSSPTYHENTQTGVRLSSSSSQSKRNTNNNPTSSQEAPTPTMIMMTPNPVATQNSVSQRILTPSTQEDQTSQSRIRPASNQTIPQTSQLTDDSQLNLTINTPPIGTQQVAFGQGDNHQQMMVDRTL